MFGTDLSRSPKNALQPPLSGTFIRQLKQRTEAFLGGAVDQVVLGRPVHFVVGDAEGDARAQDELEAIARRQGFRRVEFQFEPIAAAMACQSQMQSRGIALIIDAGGGTSDFSVVELRPVRRDDSPGSNRILANHGVRIGGTDFDASLARRTVMPLLGYQSALTRGGTVMPSWIYGELSAWRKVNFLYTRRIMTMVRELNELASKPRLVDRLLRVLQARLGHAILMSVEEAKIALTTSGTAACRLDAVEAGLAVAISTADLAAAISHDPAIDPRRHHGNRQDGRAPLRPDRQGVHHRRLDRLTNDENLDRSQFSPMSKRSKATALGASGRGLRWTRNDGSRERPGRRPGSGI